jgi:hypothetical protein
MISAQQAKASTNNTALDTGGRGLERTKRTAAHDSRLDDDFFFLLYCGGQLEEGNRLTVIKPALVITA